MSYNDNFYVPIKAHNPFVRGIARAKIKLTFKQKMQILFSKGIYVEITKGGRW